MINLFTGYDHRESVGWHVFAQSVLDRASRPVAIHRLDSCGLQQGTNAFTVSRFKVAELMGFKGHAIFADASDMLCLGDIAELDALFDPSFAVQVVKHEYKTRNPRKYIGTEMECENRDYPRKNWASLMIVNCEHPEWQNADGLSMLDLLQFNWMLDCDVGSLPDCWNRLVDEDQPLDGAKIAHWTAGIPVFPHYDAAPGSDLWFDQCCAVNHSG